MANAIDEIIKISDRHSMKLDQKYSQSGTKKDIDHIAEERHEALLNKWKILAERSSALLDQGRKEEAEEIERLCEIINKKMTEALYKSLETIKVE